MTKASFLVETFVQQGDLDQFAVDIDGLRAAAAAVDTHGPVHHVRSYLVPGDEMGVHVLDADSAEAVAQVAAMAGIRVERIVRAIGVVPGGPAEG